jgi:hypothetical protein
MDEATPKIPIGKCVELNIDEDEVSVTTEFNKKDALAVKVFNAYKDDFLHAWSIGFMPKKYKRIDSENMEDINKKYGLSVTEEALANAPWGVYLIYEWELLEYSAVPVPGNPEALSADAKKEFKSELMSRGLVTGEDVRALFEESDLREKVPAEDVEETPEEVDEEEAPAEETVEETEDEEEETVETDEVEAEDESEEVKSEEEEAPKEEETEEVEDPVQSTEEDSEETETITEERETEAEPKEVEETPAEAEVEPEAEVTPEPVVEKSSEEVKSLIQKNQELSARLEAVESELKELKNIRSILEEVKESLDVDNIEKVRGAIKGRNKAHTVDTFFSNLLKSH